MTSGETGGSERKTSGGPSAKGDEIPPARRGFASMDPAQQRVIAQAGGRAAHERGTAHRFSAEEAKAAGQKGGATVGKNRAHMAEIGRLGGQANGRKRAKGKPAAPTPERTQAQAPKDEEA